MYQEKRLNYLSQLGLLLGLVGVFMVLSTVISLIFCITIFHIPFSGLEQAIMQEENVNMARFLQIIGSFIGFGVPAFVFARIINKRPFEQLQFSTNVNAKTIFILLLLSVVCLLGANLIMQINRAIPIPSSWAVVFEQMETRYTKQAFAIINIRGLSDYLICLGIIAVLPALVEELLFRGCLQPIIVGWTRRPFVGIIITSVLFSAIHLSFYGFLVRILLGVVLGYIFYFGKNIWFNIIVHFLYNGWIVTFLYFLQREGKLTETSINEDIVQQPIISGIVLLTIVPLLILLKKANVKPERMK